MTNTATAVVAQHMEAAGAAGREQGVAAAGWATMGMDADAARRCLEMDDEGDPEWHDLWPAGSALDAAGLDPQTLIEVELGIDYWTLDEWQTEDLVSAFEEEYRDAFHDEVIRVAELHADED